MTRPVMWALLAMVAASAAVLSFDSLRGLAVLCGYPTALSALFPVTVDAGAAAACLTWLDRKTAATTVGRTLTWTLLVASVGMNGIVHYLDAYTMRPAWWLIVGVSAIPPATLGAVVHLAVLAGRTPEKAEAPGVGVEPTSRQSRGLLGEGAPAPSPPRTSATPPQPTAAPSRSKPVSVPASTDSLVSRTEQLLPIGRRALAARLDISEHQARELLRQAKPRNGVKVLEEAK